MDIDGVDLDDGAVASGGWRAAHAQAMLGIHAMPTFAGFLPAMHRALDAPVDAHALADLSALPAFSPAAPLALLVSPQDLVLAKPQQVRSLAPLPPQPVEQRPHAPASTHPPEPQPQPLRLLPRPSEIQQSPPAAVETPPPPPPPPSSSPVTTILKAEEDPAPQAVDQSSIVDLTATPAKPELAPHTSPPKAPQTRANASAKTRDAIPTDVHEIIVRAKEFRLKAPKQPTKKLKESRATGERPLDVALAEARIITQNVYVQRKQRKWEEDEVPVCSCKRPEGEGQMGCLEDCVNRAALIECLAGFCPCGDKCDNQRIQRGIMPVSEVIDAGKKGLGIKARQFIKQGDFVAEYMGEIVTEQEYHLRRLRYHHEKHRYMMVLSGGEVIDATRMGGLARFINHSCEPNCGVEKWEVDGEERCGIFALRDINSGEELSFDYKFQSFNALEITTCLCGSANCRGYIGVNNRTGKQPHRKSSASPAALPVEKGKPLDPITKQGRTSRKTLEAALERMYRALAGHKMFTRKEIALLLDSRLLLKRNVARHLEENLRLLCLEPYFVSEDGEFGDMQPVFRTRELPGFPAQPETMARDQRQARLEVVLERLRTQPR